MSREKRNASVNAATDVFISPDALNDSGNESDTSRSVTSATESRSSAQTRSSTGDLPSTVPSITSEPLGARKSTSRFGRQRGLPGRLQRRKREPREALESLGESSASEEEEDVNPWSAEARDAQKVSALPSLPPVPVGAAKDGMEVESPADLTITAPVRKDDPTVEEGSREFGESVSREEADTGHYTGSFTPSSDPGKPSTSLSRAARTPSGEPPFTLVKMVETSRVNVHRLSLFWPKVTDLLISLKSNPSSELRRFGVTALTELAILAIEEGAGREYNSKAVPQAELLHPLVHYWASEYAENRLDVLHVRVLLASFP